MRLLLIAFLLAAPLAAQKDFLTSDEVEQVREAQLPDDRLKLYLEFARQRISLLEQLFAKEKTGRSGMIHDTLDQYAKIIEAIDVYVDDALNHKKPITTLSSLAKSEREMLTALEGFSDKKTSDKERYQFVLDQALEVTRDSVELSEQDLATRVRGAEGKEVEYKKEREELMTPEQKAEADKDKAKIDAEKQGAQGTRKKPSLYKPGEKPGSGPLPPPDPPKDPPKK